MDTYQKHIWLPISLLIVFTISMNPMLAEVSAVPNPIDDSELAIDGPHVFYESNKVIVKSIREVQGRFELVKKEYPSRAQVPPLSCFLDKSRSFKIRLKEKIQPMPSDVPQPSRLFAISDIEGNFHAFTHSLIGNGVVDRQLNWTYGDGHLVLVGDFFDRGLNVTACLWLIYHLESQAEAQGGMVHFILGNHEEMNLSGDHRYVRTKYLKVAKKLGCSYADLYAPNTELGKWLRSKNMIVKIGRTIFVHGGLSPQMANCNLSIKQINKICRAHIGQPSGTLQEKGGNVSLVFSKSGPFWYRGFFNSLSADMVAKILTKFDADQVVVGHTIVDDISTLQNGMVYAIDVKHSDKIKNAQYNAMLIENGRFFKVNYKGQREAIQAVRKNGNDGSTVVFEAIRKNDKSQVVAFLNKGHNINELYSSKEYPLLHYAIEHGKPEIVKLLLEKGANPDLFFDGRSALMQSIKYKNIHAFKLLLEHAVDVNLANHRLQTALYYVGKYGNLELAEALLNAGAQLNTIDQAGLTPFQFAVKNRNIEVAKFLKTSGESK